jgi:CBS-domain-containing membrane protein
MNHLLASSLKNVTDIVVRQPARDLPPLKLDDPAALAVVDFESNPAFTVHPHRLISGAMHDMMNFGVRSLLVVSEGGELLGLVTAYDIMGERPILYLQSHRCTLDFCTYADITVADIMTAVLDLSFLDIDDLVHTRVRDLVHLFESLSATHLLVVTDYGAQSVVMGIVSATQVARQLAMAVETDATTNPRQALYRAFKGEWQA